MTAQRIDLSIDPDFVTDPYPTLAALRETEPGIHRVTYHGAPTWFVTRIAEAEAVYADARFSADNRYTTDDVRAVSWIAAPDLAGFGSMMVYRDPPDHTRLRRLVARAFTARRIAALRPMIQSIADELLDVQVPRGRFDVLNDFSSPLTAQTIMVLLGAPLADRDTFVEYSHLFLSTDPADQARLPQALEYMRTTIAELVAAKAAAPADDLLSALIAAHDEEERLSEDELHAMALLVLMSGFETTAGFIPNALLALLDQPDRLAELRAAPALLPAAVEELLRYASTSASLARYATEDLTLGGVEIKRGEAVVVSWAAANRDPRRFTDPDTLRFGRAENRHIAFAHGIHHCLGAPLARLEAEVALGSLLARCARIRLAVPRSELTYRITPNVRSVTGFPIVCEA